MSREYVIHPFNAPASFQIDYAGELNEQQHAAVTATPGPALVIAGAGAGKTRTLIYRVAYLLEQGIPADRILLLTFTNKAAREMMSRVGDLLGGDLSDLWGGTFHSIGHRFLRRHADLLGYGKSFTILDREDSRDLLKACLGDSKIDIKETRFPKVDVLADVLSLAVNTCRTIGEVLEEEFNYFSQLEPQIAALAASYVERKGEANVMDFDDLQVLWLKLLRENAELRERYQRRFQFILVDEYQDTNRIQGDLIDLLAERHGNVMVVGDDSQSIYSWRGADFQNILEFPKRHEGAQVYKIETNYRSTPEILNVANAAILSNRNQFEKELAAVRGGGLKPAVVMCGDARVQSTFIAQRLLELRDEGGDLNRMAVLYRSHFHALELQLELTRRNIPFSITSGIRFFEQAHIKDVTAYIKLVANPRDEMSFKRLARLLPGIGDKSAAKLWGIFHSKLGEKGEKNPHPIAAAVQGCSGKVPKKAVERWANLSITLSQLEADEVKDRPDRMIRMVLDAGYEDYLKETYTNYRSRQEDLEQLAGFSLQFTGTEDFLSQLSLLSNLEAEDDRSGVGDDERVKLSSIHQAKGLEFDSVFVIMLCEGMFPSSRSVDVEESLEEERRLFYVAITRARNDLYLSFPMVRMMQGVGEQMQQPSRFLSEIPSDLIENWNLKCEGMYY